MDLASGRRITSGESAIDQLTATFGLSPFERDLLLLSVGATMDSEIGSLCARATGGLWATAGLGLAALPDSHWSALLPSAPLRRFRLVEVNDEPWTPGGPLIVPEVVLHYVSGFDVLDPYLETVVVRIPPPPVMVASHRMAALAVQDLLDETDRAIVVQLLGDDLDGQIDVAAGVAASLGGVVLMLDADDLPAKPGERRALTTALARQSGLSGAVILLQVSSTYDERATSAFIESCTAPLLVASQHAFDTRRASSWVAVDRPPRGEQDELWDTGLRGAPAQVLRLAGRYGRRENLSSRAIAQRIAAIRMSGPGAASAARITPVAAASSGLWQNVESTASWSSLIVPDVQTETLQQIATQVRLSSTVYERWGFDKPHRRGLGITALFAGESGTGKTLAAEVLANELGLDLRRIDLSAVVSKYIGETEKSLRAVFDAAEDSGAVLLFDEADALFGKRSDVKDSHDRYANIEVSYLLQRMDAYQGLAVLATNARAALDSAFLRRIRFIVQFPFPDAAIREQIWRATFPRAVPHRRLDFGRLARVALTGGSIRNCAINGAFFAAEEGTPVLMRHLRRAIAAELSKRDRGGTLGRSEESVLA
jgi:hypothetical protein